MDFLGGSMRRTLARASAAARVAFTGAAILCASAGLLAQTALSTAQSLPSVVPMPPLPPMPKEGSLEKASTTQAIPAAAAPSGLTKSAATAPSPIKPGKTATFDSAQKATVERVNSYFNAIHTLVGNFVQVGPDGRRSEGEFYMQKPGKVRFDYDPPSPVELISDGKSVAVRDRKLATQDLYPLSQTPLRFLLSEKLDLFKDSNVVGVYQDDIFVTVVIEENQPIVGTHRLMIMFGAKDTQLKQWTVTDPQGYDTTVAVYNLNQAQKPDPAMFRIEYQRMLQ
jgi:outer membrane lipoprotein-sorting protein